MSKSRKIASCIIILGITFAGITLYLGLNHKFNDSIMNIYYFFYVLLTLIETLFVIYFLIREKREALLHGDIIYQFSKLDYKKEIVFMLLYAVLTMYFIIVLFKKPSVVTICLVWMFLTIILMYTTNVFTKKGISKIGIDSLLWNQIDYLELDKNNRSIKYKSNGWTRISIHKIADKDWNDTIEEFLKHHHQALK